MPKKHTTLKDLANELGIHFTTVSRALRNHPNVSPETRKRVLELAEERGYQPDSIAQNLKSKKSYTIAVMVPEIQNDFFSSVISGIEEVAYQEGYTIMVFQSNEDYQREQLNLRPIVSQRVAGLLISVSKSTLNGNHFKKLEKQHIPIVFFDRFCKDVKASRVYTDDYIGAMKAVEHLISQGYQRIAHLAGPESVSVSKSRFEGYVHALKKHNVHIEESLIIYGGFQEEDGRQGLRKLLDNNLRPDAVFTVNDFVASGVYLQAKESGILIPRDLAVVGFGNNNISKLMSPPLTTVRQSTREMGIRAAKLLLREINTKEDEFMPITEVIIPELEVREST